MGSPAPVDEGSGGSSTSSEQRRLTPPPTSASTAPSAPSRPRNTSAGDGAHAGADVGAGAGAFRRPRRLTASELHSQFEHEQEYVTNQLSRKLSALRKASFGPSNTLSASAATSVFTDAYGLPGSGFPVFTGHRHHRTSSGTSTRSLTQAPLSGNAAAVLEAARNPRGGLGISRQSSVASRTSQHRNHSPQPLVSGGATSAPTPYSSAHSPPKFPCGWRSPNPSITGTAGSDSEPSLGSTSEFSLDQTQFSPGQRFRERHEFSSLKAELDLLKYENESLKRRVQELQKMLQNISEGDSQFDLDSNKSTGHGGSSMCDLEDSD
ncbi:hypothetical protein F4802DRAFT_83919 [Xylaria palmicola]|nr:hypothetical protein F4802DRAFT_83919 [Xylaria palmicola]